MASLNVVHLIGNLGANPELKRSQNGKAFCHVGLATNEGRGEKKRTEWHNLVMFDKTAEFVCQYLKKGDSLYVQGKIATNKWKDKESGEDRSRTEIQVFQAVALSSRRAEGGGGETAEPQGSSFDPDADEIPF